MARKYWLDLFTGKTWEEFLKDGATVSGFRQRRKNTVKKIKAGDYLICYLTGISRLVAILEVKSELYIDNTPIWEDEIFPCRLKVKLIYKLEPKTAIPIVKLRDKLSIFKNPKYWSGFVRGSPKEFNTNDGEIIIEEIKNATSNPIELDFDERKYWRKPKTYESKIGVVTVPEEDEEKDETQLPTIGSNEINRPTFGKLKPPLPKICKFIPYSELKKEIEQIGNRVRYMRPEFIDEIAESCEPEEV